MSVIRSDPDPYFLDCRSELFFEGRIQICFFLEGRIRIWVNSTRIRNPALKHYLVK